MGTASDFRYMPILKWKLGEQVALQKVDDPDRVLMLPIIEFQPLVIKKNDRSGTIKNNIEKATLSLIKSDGKNHAVAVDTLAFLSTTTTVKTVRTICDYFSKNDLQVFPVIHPSMVENEAAELSILSHYSDVVLRIKVFNCLAAQIEQVITEAFVAVNNPEIRIHVVLDMFSIVNADPGQLANRMKDFVEVALQHERAYTVTLAGGSFPFNLTGIAKGNTLIPRVEWKVWKKILSAYPDIRFGDYAVTNPDPLAEIDPLKINPSAAIRYALQSEWMLLKAGGVRTYGFGQYNDLCELLILEPDYSTEEFSFGDEKYNFHAQPGAPTGNMTTWRRDATSHHLALTVRNCATLFGF